FYYGHGVAEQSYRRAKEWYEKAAAQNDAKACNKLGEMYYTGTGVPQNFAQARLGFQIAADQHNKWGEYNLGKAYLEGHIPDDHPNDKAKEWFEKSAEQGLPEAACALGDMYLEGK